MQIVSLQLLYWPEYEFLFSNSLSVEGKGGGGRLPVIGGWESIVGIATHYRTSNLGIKFWWGGKNFRTHPHWPWGPSSLPYNAYWVPFLEVKQLGLGINHPSPSSTPVKESRTIHLVPPGPSRPVSIL